MDFKMSNFQIGINENGFHFRDSKSGVIFTLVEARYGELIVAICVESASNQICKQLQTWLEEEMKKAGEQIKFAENIELEKCYISENQEEFQWVNLAMDSIGLKSANKIIGIQKILDNKLVVGIFAPEIYDAEYTIEKLFQLCSSNIKEIQVNVSGFASCEIKSHYETVTIRRLLIQATGEAFVEEIKSNYGEPRYEVLPSGNIEIWYSKFDKIRIVKCKEEGQYMHFNIADEKSAYVSCLIRVIEAMKKFPEIEKLKYIYVWGPKYKNKKITITRENVDSILKKTIKEKRILLTM